MNPHPLIVWVNRTGTTIFALSKAAKIPFRSLYNFVNHKVPVNPRATTIIAIEDATEGMVSAQSQIDWIRERDKK